MDSRSGCQLAVGDLVFLKRSDGTLRYGEVVAKAGMAWQNSWEVGSLTYLVCSCL